LPKEAITSVALTIPHVSERVRVLFARAMEIASADRQVGIVGAQGGVAILALPTPWLSGHQSRLELEMGSNHRVL